MCLGAPSGEGHPAPEPGLGGCAGATHKGWCRSVCSLSVGLPQPGTPVPSAAHRAQGWSHRNAYDLPRTVQGGQWCLGAAQPMDGRLTGLPWQCATGGFLCHLETGHCLNAKLMFMPSIRSLGHQPPAPIWPRGIGTMDHLQSLCGQGGPSL